MSMPTQRSGGEGDDDSGTSRRQFLGAVGGVTLGAGGVGTMLRGGDGSEPVSLLVAGSLQRTADRLAGRVDPALQTEAHGSVTAARLVAEGKRDPDLIALADTDLFSAPLSADWHAAFATNALVVAYDGESAGGRRVAEADRWFEPVIDGAATLGRTDPDLDPLGYRTLFALDLAKEYYDRPGLAGAVIEPDQIYPETSLLGRFETGEVDAAVVYRNMAVERGYDYLDLPAALDLGDPGRDEHYRTATYTLPDGQVVRGEHIAYGVQARVDDERVRAVYAALTDADVLESGGFGVPETYPAFRGNVPDGYR
jgi:molybdate/tungstate transport system substrate-binding protein